MGYARLQADPFSLDQVLAEFDDHRIGGVNTYVGTVRGDDDGQQVQALTYEAYGEMAQAELEALRQDAVRRFGLVDATVIHRTGRLGRGEPILLVALAGRHRDETYAAIAWFMDELKRRVPIWKREETEGGPQWILGRERRRVSP